MMDRIISLVEQVRGEFGGRTIFQTAENSGATDTTSAECDDGMPPAPVMRSGLKVFCFIANSAVLIICAEINDISPTVTVGFAIKIFI